MDTTARIVSRLVDGNSLRFRFEPQDRMLLKYIVEKGYIGLDGTSLTVTEVDETSFSVMLVAYTQTKVVMGDKSVDDVVNVEVDMIGKYVEKQVAAHLAAMRALS